MGARATISLLASCFFGVCVTLLGAPAAHAADRININTASAPVLETLPGIGEARAADIVAYRNTHGAFGTTADIMQVPGIGDGIFSDISALITVTDGTDDDDTDDTDGTGTDDEDDEQADDTDDDADEGDGDTQGDTGDSSSAGSGGSGGADNRRFSSATDLAIVVDVPEYAYVHRRAQFSVTPEDLTTSELMTMQYRWNFGDGTTADRRTPEHTYTAPGTYKVVVRVRRDGHEAVGTSEVVVHPLSVTLARTGDGRVQVRNTAEHEIDVSGMRLTDGTETFTVPADTFLLPRATITLPAAVTGFARTDAPFVARDARGKLLAAYAPGGVSAPAARTAPHTAQRSAGARTPAPQVAQSKAAPPLAAQTDVPTEAAAPHPDEPPPAARVTPGTTPGEHQIAAASESADGLPTSGRDAVPYALAGMLAVAILALYVHKLT